MAKIWVEVCLISARGLRRRSSLWKRQWFSVGWINQNNKYCTKIDASGSANPTWKTKFSVLIDDLEPNLQAKALHVEVYSRDPIFLREKLHGTATVLLKEFFTKYMNNSETSKPELEEVGSFQLRKKGSGKPQGFIDVSIRIFGERGGESSYIGKEEGTKLSYQGREISLTEENGPMQAQPCPQRPSETYPQMSSSNAYPMPIPGNPSLGGPSYRPPPPPPPPPSYTGYLPTFLPRTNQSSGTNMNIPTTGTAAGHNTGPGFGMGVGAGALAAGAMIFGDDFMSGFELPSNLTISTDPPF
ncbi:hypothetical protein GIB67_000063 [Kingdonia uniflora]|uniref:C2 domain-containing protein n=1 Tax=Kingdonia uniflora TaxID=39325 RepID=A0A7J7NWU8_9MAGN|nr:hypothetical protein GIB67_041061 [Kingdonia uniflora]KAF6171676.1 hypothetical protein GIB67_000063 [Kingdonia uniflora]